MDSNAFLLQKRVNGFGTIAGTHIKVDEKKRKKKEEESSF